MGYPMTYRRVVERNHLKGDYQGTLKAGESIAGSLPITWAIAGDLRRLEHDQQDAEHLAKYSNASGATVEQVKKIFDLFFTMGQQEF